MKTLFLFLALFSGVVSAAGEVSFKMVQVGVADLARVVLEDVAGESVIVASEVVEDRSLLNFVIRKVTPAQAVEQLRQVVKGRGFELVRHEGVYHLRRPGEIESDMFVYLPKYRSVSYLSDLIGGILPRQAVASQRAIPQYQQGGAYLGQQAVMSQGYETGTNVNSMIDKSDKDSLVVKGKPAELAMVKRLLQEVDRPIPEMLVKAVIMEVQTGSGEGSALNFLLKAAGAIGSASVSWQGGADNKNGIQFKVGGLEALWSAINSDSRFKIVSAPQIRVKSGGAARFSVGSETPVLGAVNYQGNGQSVQSVEYKPAGVILDLKPEIRGKLAELKIFQQLSSFVKTETGVNNSPTLLKRELSTSVVVAENDVVLLGGLDEEKNTADSSGFFFMPDAMRSRSSSKARSEIILMLYVERVQTPGEAI